MPDSLLQQSILTADSNSIPYSTPSRSYWSYTTLIHTLNLTRLTPIQKLLVIYKAYPNPKPNQAYLYSDTIGHTILIQTPTQPDLSPPRNYRLQLYNTHPHPKPDQTHPHSESISHLEPHPYSKQGPQTDPI